MRNQITRRLIGPDVNRSFDKGSAKRALIEIPLSSIHVTLVVWWGEWLFSLFKHDAARCEKKTHTRHKSPMAMHMALQFIWAGVGREERQLQLECRMWSFFYLIEKCFRVDAVLHDGWCYVGISRRGRIESLWTESETHTCTVERAISLPDGEGKRMPPQLPQAASGGYKLIYTVRRQMQ